MSASHAPALDAIAFQLAAALERYDEAMGRMLDDWLDMELYRSVSEQIEEIRAYSGALPQLSAAWVELLIAHAELVHALWKRHANPGADDGRLAELRARHAGCVATLKTRCLRLLARSEQRIA